MIGRPRKPTALKRAEGNPGKRPLNEREPKPESATPRCPAWLDDESGVEWRRVVPRETVIGLLNGLALGLLVALLAWAWKGNAYLGLAVGVAMLGNMIVAGLAGVIVPTSLRFVRADPALASSIFVTSVTDIMGYFFFLGLAALMIDRIA